MASVNQVIIVGNLGRDPEMRFLPSGEAIANIAVATSYKTKDRNSGEQRELTEWHRISAFGRTAEIIGQYLKKGSSVYVQGRLQTRKYTDKDGIDRYATDIICENLQMLNSPRDAGHDQGGHDTPPRQQPAQRQGQSSQREQNRERQYAQGQRPAAPNFSDMDSDIPF